LFWHLLACRRLMFLFLDIVVSVSNAVFAV